MITSFIIDFFNRIESQKEEKRVLNKQKEYLEKIKKNTFSFLVFKDNIVYLENNQYIVTKEQLNSGKCLAYCFCDFFSKKSFELSDQNIDEIWSIFKVRKNSYVNLKNSRFKFEFVGSL